MKKFISTLFVTLFFFTLNVVAQDGQTVMLFGNDNQPGYLLHKDVVSMVDQGNTLDFSAKSVLDNVLAIESLVLPEGAKNAVASNSFISLSFITLMVEQNDLFNVTKTLIETYPANVSDIIGLSVSLYPDFAQVAVDAATITGEIEASDALIAAISAGADPTSVSAATAAGPTAATTVAAAPVPLGAGIGSAGSGGGDSTASNN